MLITFGSEFLNSNQTHAGACTVFCSGGKAIRKLVHDELGRLKSPAGKILERGAVRKSYSAVYIVLDAPVVWHLPHLPSACTCIKGLMSIYTASSWSLN